MRILNSRFVIIKYPLGEDWRKLWLIPLLSRKEKYLAWSIFPGWIFRLSWNSEILEKPLTRILKIVGRIFPKVTLTLPTVDKTHVGIFLLLVINEGDKKIQTMVPIRIPLHFFEDSDQMLQEVIEQYIKNKGIKITEVDNGN